MNSKIKVLIIDDSATTRALIRKYLGDKYDCIEASNGELGWEVLTKDTSISLVFADMHMPVLNGVQVWNLPISAGPTKGGRPDDKETIAVRETAV